MQKRRALSLFLVLVMVFSLLPGTVQASGETAAIAIQEKTITTSTTTVTVKVTGYEGLSNATLRLSVGPDGTESDWGISNPPRTALGSLKYTGPDTYTFAIDPAKLAAGKNVQAYLYYWSDSRDDWAYTYGYPVEITDGDPVPSVSIGTQNVTNRTTELSVTLKNLPASGIFRVIQLGAEETYDSARLNSYTSLYFSVVGNLHAGENTLKLTAAPEAGSRLLAVLRDSSGSETKDYMSQPVTVAYEQEPSIVSIVGEVDSASTTVKVSLTRVPSSGILKVIALDAGEKIPSNVFNFDYSSALYTGYFAAGGLHTGENTLTLSAAPAAGKILYAVVRDSSVTPSADYVSEGVAVAQAYTPFAMYIKGELTNSSTTLSVFPKMKRYNAQPSVLESAALFRAGVQTPLAELEAPKMGELMTFTGLRGLTAGEKLTLTVTYDGGRTAAWEYLVCDAAEENSFEIVEKTFTTTSTTVTVKVSGYNWYNNREDWSRICITTGSASQTEPGDDEGREDLTSQVFTGKGTYTFTIPADKMSELQEGNSIMAALRFYDGHGVEGTVDFEWYAAADSVLISAASKTPLERLENCSVTMLKDGQPRTETFRQEQTSIDYAVTLDNEIPSATLGFYAYPGTVAFDPDGGHKISLGSVKVTQSGTGTIPVDLTNVPAGYRVIASLYVCIDGDEWYRHVNLAQTPEVVDENGKGFEPYVYPDATIDETELWVGDTSLHMSLTGDARFFEYAAQGQITINVALAQYPADEDFDFEGSDQISLGSAFRVTEAFSGREFTFADKPLREGYRVRAVVYWTQNADLFIAKGNDYESFFHLPDDSVLVSGSAQSAPSVAAKPVTAGDTSVTFTVAGAIPEGALLLVKSYDAGTTEFLTTGGTPLGVVNPVSAGDVTLPVSGDALTAGRIVAAFLLKDGAVQAQSQPVTVSEPKPAALFTIKPQGTLTAASTSLAFTLETSDPTKEINAVYLYRLAGGKIADYDKPLAANRKAAAGDNTITIPAGVLTAGETLRVVVQYWKDDDLRYFEAGDVTVAAEQEADSIAIQETSFTVNSTTATVNVSGYEAYQGGLLVLTTGSASTNGDGDSRTRLGSRTYAGSGSYTFDFGSGKLTGGNTVQAYLYRYDGDADRTYYQYSEAVSIEKEATEPTVSIVTKNVTTDTEAVYVSAEFDDSALLTLYGYTGDSFDAAANASDYCGIQYLASAPSSSQKVTLTRALTEGEKLIAVLWSGGLGKTILAQSQPVMAAKAPEKEKPGAYLLTQKVTAGMTNLTASMRFDSSIKYAEYKLYQFDGDTLNAETAEVLVSGGLYRSQTNQALYVGVGRLKVGSKLQLVLTAGGEEARSAVLVVQPSPDWGTPYAAFSVSAVKSDAASVSLTVDYSDQYLTMGDEFYCDVTVYACSGEYSDDEIEDNELWENFRICRVVAKANSRMGGETRGELTLDFYDTAALQAGEKLFIKLRLPHVEWEGEEVDYVSASIPVIAADDEIPEYRVVLYNLESDTSRGARLRTILSQLNVPVMEMTYENLNQSVGYLAGLEGYEAAASAYDGRDYDAEFMLICNLPESLLDRFLDAMQSDGLRIDHKAVVTAYNRDRLYYELMDEIADEHNVFQMLLMLNDLIAQSKKLTEAEYGASDHWDALQEAIAAGEALIRSEEPSYEDMLEAYERLKAEYLAVTGQTEIDGIAAITIAPEAGGTYTMTASVLGGSAARQYAYTWSNGSSAQTLMGIPAERLIGTTLTVTAAGCYGKLTAQLMVPAYTAPEVSADKNTVTVKLHPAEAATNTPAAEQYIVMLYQDETLLETKTVQTAQSVVFSGLSEKTAYTVKSYAVSPVGRSDILTQHTTTTAGSATKPGTDSVSTGRFRVVILESRNGNVTANVSRTDSGNVVTLTVSPALGFTLDKLTVLDSSSRAVRLTEQANGTYTFVMPASDATVEAVFQIRLAFTDVPSGSYYEDAVLWAVGEGITTGISAHAFAPDGSCTRAQAVTFLWRAAGSPAPVSAKTRFADVAASSYYSDAVLWAVENGITNGTSDTTFSPDAVCTRAQIVVFLWRAKERTAAGSGTRFADVAETAYYADAVLWAVKEGVTLGTSANAFSPDETCTRAQIVTFLWRTLAK